MEIDTNLPDGETLNLLNKIKSLGEDLDLKADLSVNNLFKSWVFKLKNFVDNEGLGRAMGFTITDNGIRFLCWGQRGEYYYDTQSKDEIEKFIQSQLSKDKPSPETHIQEYSNEEQSIIDKAKKNGTFMKAPNGKPTNLT